MHARRPRHRRTPAIALAALAVALLSATDAAPASVASIRIQPAVAPYLDMPGPNSGNLDAAIKAGLGGVTASFVIGRACAPTWDDGVPVAKDRAVTALIANAQAEGAQVIASFGGAGGKDLARTCTDLGKLTAAYQSVVSRFGVTDVDFDVEGAAIKPKQQHASIARRFAAIRALETADPDLAVSVTIGVGQTGLPPAQMSFLGVAKRTDTRLDLVNIMTMDYGGAVSDMGAVAVAAAQDSLAQLQTLWPDDTYADLGITPMIGRNDSAGEVTTLADAADITTFARDSGVGRLAFWSLNRDQQCGRRTRRARSGCSGVQQAPLAYTGVFLGRTGDARRDDP